MAACVWLRVGWSGARLVRQMAVGHGDRQQALDSGRRAVAWSGTWLWRQTEGSGRQTAGGRQQTEGSGQQASDNRRKVAGNRRQATGNRQQTAGNRKQAADAARRKGAGYAARAAM